jgi:hypothetical protein
MGGQYATRPKGPTPDYTALDGATVVGRVYRIDGGPEQGLWFWSMTAHRPGPRPQILTSGKEARRGDAGRRVVEAYERLLAGSIRNP